MKRDNYGIDDFILNESFQRYAIQPTADDIEYWDTWVKENPGFSEVFLRSKEIIQFIVTKRTKPKHLELSEEVFLKLKKQIQAETVINNDITKTASFKYYWIAASIALMLGMTWMLSKKLIKQENTLAGQFLEVIVPEGQRSQLLLPDGTQVWLNAGTHFKYPSEFLKERRDVFIEGEGFFKVAHNARKPFVVHMKENLSVKVLGTEFNIKCYSTDKIIETTLVKGSIRLIKEDSKNHIVQELNLHPKEKATYFKANKKLTIASVEAPSAAKAEPQTAASTSQQVTPKNTMEQITAWKDDALIFQDETFEDIAIRMERWFGLKIRIADESLKKERFAGKFVNKENIYQILDIFNRAEPIQYSTQNKEITITRKSKQH